MPIIHVNMLEGRTEEQKRKIAEGIVEVMVKEAKVKEEAVRIIFNDMKGENLAIGKKLAKE
ncbi:MAG: hypothetical protein HPY66_3373 [Firmicutes bacterium]|nr:hypothetical protein [Bacillota bacterium]MDI6706283.1 tautomerase family protein [Bacillota bacterium]